MNVAARKEYWNGYRAMKCLAYEYCNASKAFREIYSSNASNTFVNGARRALRYIERVGVWNITI